MRRLIIAGHPYVVGTSQEIREYTDFLFAMAEKAESAHRCYRWSTFYADKPILLPNRVYAVDLDWTDAGSGSNTAYWAVITGDSLLRELLRGYMPRAGIAGLW